MGQTVDDPSGRPGDDRRWTLALALASLLLCTFLWTLAVLDEWMPPALTRGALWLLQVPVGAAVLVVAFLGARKTGTAWRRDAIGQAMTAGFAMLVFVGIAVELLNLTTLAQSESLDNGVGAWVLDPLVGMLPVLLVSPWLAAWITFRTSSRAQEVIDRRTSVMLDRLRSRAAVVLWFLAPPGIVYVMAALGRGGSDEPWLTMVAMGAVIPLGDRLVVGRPTRLVRAAWSVAASTLSVALGLLALDHVSGPSDISWLIFWPVAWAVSLIGGIGGWTLAFQWRGWMDQLRAARAARQD